MKPGPQLLDGDHVDFLVRIVTERALDVIYLDALGVMTQQRRSNEHDAGALVAGLRKIEATGAVLRIVHHTAKRRANGYTPDTATVRDGSGQLLFSRRKMATLESGLVEVPSLLRFEGSDGAPAKLGLVPSPSPDEPCPRTPRALPVLVASRRPARAPARRVADPAGVAASPTRGEPPSVSADDDLDHFSCVELLSTTFDAARALRRQILDGCALLRPLARRLLRRHHRASLAQRHNPSNVSNFTHTSRPAACCWGRGTTRRTTMPSTLQPATGASLTCDACGVNRIWGAWDSNSKSVVCATCLSKGRFSVARGTTVTRGQRHEAGYESPSDAVAAPTISAAKVIREA